MVLRRAPIIFIVLMFISISMFYPRRLLAQGYSRQDIRSLIDYFREYDAKARPFIVAEKDRLEELVEESYQDLKAHTDKGNLKQFIQDLYNKLIAKCDTLIKQTDNELVKGGFYDPSSVSNEFNKLNLEAARLLLRIKILGYLYQYKYNELPLNKDILCPLFYIYSTTNKVKGCNAP
ncbi:MAG: hypothetical protein NC914_02395 [Candidatus Omnitrophica bacterium]|nr:hypothetical protein [Candidatus Omnitrophota bacterium]